METTAFKDTGRPLHPLIVDGLGLDEVTDFVPVTKPPPETLSPMMCRLIDGFVAIFAMMVMGPRTQPIERPVEPVSVVSTYGLLAPPPFPSPCCGAPMRCNPGVPSDSFERARPSCSKCNRTFGPDYRS